MEYPAQLATFNHMLRYDGRFQQTNKWHTAKSKFFIVGWLIECGLETGKTEDGIGDGNKREFTDEGEKVVAVSCIGQAVRLRNDFKDLKQLISLNVGLLRIYSGNKVQD